MELLKHWQKYLSVCGSAPRAVAMPMAKMLEQAPASDWPGALIALRELKVGAVDVLSHIDKENRHVLHALATLQSKKAAELTNFLLTQGADVHVQTTFEKLTPLHVAATHSLPQVRVLLQNQANPNTIDYYQRTPLFEASAEAVPELVQAGATLDVCDWELRGLLAHLCSQSLEPTLRRQRLVALIDAEAPFPRSTEVGRIAPDILEEVRVLYHERHLAMRAPLSSLRGGARL